MAYRLLNRTRRNAEDLVYAIPDANVELLDMFDVTSVQGPPPSVIVSTVPRSTTTAEEHVTDRLSVPRTSTALMSASS
jgi:pentafunctional AROM polypeptide